MIVQLRGGAGLRAENAALKDEIWRLKGLRPRPTLKPSGVEQLSKRSSPAATDPKRSGSSRAIVTGGRRLCYEPPLGSRFLGGQASWAGSGGRGAGGPLSSGPLPDGPIVVAPLPDGVDGHFGLELRRLVLSLYHQGQSTVERSSRCCATSACRSPSARSCGF